MKLHIQPGILLSVCVFFTLLLIGCKPDVDDPGDERPEPATLDLTFEESVVITGDESVPESLLGVPLVVKTDSDGYIYVTDTQFIGIKVYSPEGTFFGTIGREGQGPGEFTGSPAFTLTGDNNILTYSNYSGSRFSREGDLFDTFVVDSNRLALPGNFFLSMPDGRHVVNRNNRNAGEPSDPDYQIRQHNLHIVSSDFNSVQDSFANPDTMVLVDLLVANTYTRVYHSRMWATDDGIWYVPSIYEGHLYRYEETETGWVLAETVDGYVYPDTPVIEVEDFESGPNTWGVVTYNGLEAESYYGSFNSVSIGLFTLNDGRLIHFSNQLLGEEMRTVVELFGEDGQLAGAGQLENFVLPAGVGGGQRYPVWKDGSDRFYLVDESSEPIIRVGRFTGL